MPLLADHLDFAKLEARNLKLQELSAEPSSPALGQVFFNTVQDKMGVRTAAGWLYLGSGGAGDPNAVTRAAAAGAAGELAVSGGADRTLGSWTSNGLVKIAAGIVAVAVADTDYVTPSGAGAFTNKTINGSNNTISNLVLAMFAANVIDTDVALAANSDARLATQKAVKAYVDGRVTGLAEYIGVIDASGNPNYPAASKGDYHRISVAGRIGGASGPVVQAGDVIMANADNAGGTHAAVGASWDIIQGNIDQATTAAMGLVQLATSTEAEAKSDANKAVTPAALVNFPVKKSFTFGDGTSLSYALAHNLNTNDLVAQVRQASNNEVVLVTIVGTNANTVTVTFASAPASNSIKATIIG